MTESDTRWWERYDAAVAEGHETGDAERIADAEVSSRRQCKECEMAALVVEAGQTVEYRGGLVEAHGLYRVVEVRPTWAVAHHGGEEVVPRLVLEPLAGGRRLRGVRLQSVVVVEEVSR